MWLHYGNQHTFTVKTSEGNNLPSAKAQSDEEVEFEEINQNYGDQREKDIFSSLNCRVTKLLLSPERKFILHL